jgi:hypothetical protein
MRNSLRAQGKAKLCFGAIGLCPGVQRQYHGARVSADVNHIRLFFEGARALVKKLSGR